MIFVRQANFSLENECIMVYNIDLENLEFAEEALSVEFGFTISPVWCTCEFLKKETQ